MINLKCEIKEDNSNRMTDSNFDNKVRIAKTHIQAPNGSIEVIIPKSLCEQYDLTEPTHVMIIPEEDSFRIMKLRLATPGQEIKQ